jgi:hypothetical protein
VPYAKPNLLVSNRFQVTRGKRAMIIINTAILVSFVFEESTMSCGALVEYRPGMARILTCYSASAPLPSVSTVTPGVSLENTSCVSKASKCATVIAFVVWPVCIAVRIVRPTNRHFCRLATSKAEGIETKVHISEWNSSEVVVKGISR